MFTGIIQDQGTLIKKIKEENGFVFKIKSQLPQSAFYIGNSIAVDGVCLTVEEYNSTRKEFSVTVVEETLQKTTFNDVRIDTKVNLELPLSLNSFVAGHLVSGHVDGKAKVENNDDYLTLKVHKSLIKYMPVKGSICVNGVSLTIANVDDFKIFIALIPETKKKTNLGGLKSGDYVNIEVDLIARYLENFRK